MPFLLAISGCGDVSHSQDPNASAKHRVVALNTSLPIFWGEGTDISDFLSADDKPHWALAVLREYGQLRPMDSLADLAEIPVQANRTLLVMAQPYPLSPQENVALDDWVRAGGHVLLFADPMLTQDSEFSIGDRRRPQDVILLSPILKRWGLTLQFDEDQRPRERVVPVAGAPVPVNLPGVLVPNREEATCRIEAAGLLALCRIGRGQALVLADAAILESRSDDTVGVRQKALRELIDRSLTSAK